jgi:hypothetical protein
MFVDARDAPAARGVPCGKVADIIALGVSWI